MSKILNGLLKIMVILATPFILLSLLIGRLDRCAKYQQVKHERELKRNNPFWD